MTSGEYSDEELEYSKSESGESESYYDMPEIGSDLAESGGPDFLVIA
jgi:hypothetical protein